MDPVSLLAFLDILPATWRSTGAVIVGGLCILSAVCGAIDSAFRQPRPGSIWVRPRQAIAFIALNFGHARNRIPAGLPEPERRILAVLDRATDTGSSATIVSQVGPQTLSASINPPATNPVAIPASADTGKIP